MSTNKVYGDAPNRIPLKELETRWEYADPDTGSTASRDLLHRPIPAFLFGASKVAGDIMVQEYGRYFGMPTCCLRGGCLTGPNHSGVELHGFLSYLVKCNLEGREYTVYGYKGKQVRDNIHSEDVARFMHEFFLNPRCGEVYNLGGGKDNSCSILEAFEMVEAVTAGRKQVYAYVDQNRIGDHICYYSDLRKMKPHYPRWDITRPLTSKSSQRNRRRPGTNASLPEIGSRMKVLITGICGFVGGALAAQLKRQLEGVEILGLDNLSRPGSEQNRARLAKSGDPVSPRGCP